MTEPPLEPAEPVIRPPHRWLPSVVWAIPLLAALVGAALVVQALWSRGPTITVSFGTADGIEAGKTKVKFKAVDIGEVTAVHLSPDRTRVLVSIDLVKEASRFAVADSRFWVVRPRLAGSGVSGLETLFSGSYIGVDAGYSDQRADSFAGLDGPPAVAADIPGRRFRLHAEDIGSLDVGSPVFFRRIPVGHVESTALDPDGRGLTLGIFVKGPYERFVTHQARFWHASGIDLRVDASGVKLDTQSLASILMGGIAFEPTGESTEGAPDGTEFPLATSRIEAMKAPDGEIFPMIVRFHQTVRGLTVGAPVDFRGVELGVVRAIDLTYDRRSGDFSPVVRIDLYPDRLNLTDTADGVTRDHRKRMRGLAELVQPGLRAQFRTGSLLTGQLFVALDFFPDALPAAFDPTTSPLEMPSVPGDLQELYQQAQSILRKLDKIPFDTLGQDLHRVLVDLDSTLKRLDSAVHRTETDLMPELRASLEGTRRALEGLEGAMAGDSPLHQDTRQALQALSEAARALKALGENLDRQPESLLRGKRETE
jgi:paraquat-inducible protein B